MSPRSAATPLDLYAFLLLSVATLAQIGISLAQQGIGVLAFAFLRRYHLSLAGAGALVTVTSLGMVASMLIGGRVIDRRGPRPVLAASALLAAAAALLIGRVQSARELDLALVLLGFALGAAPIAGARAVFVRFEGRLRATAMGVRQTGVPLGAALAAALLPPLAVRLGPAGVFPPLAIELLVLGLAFALLIGPLRAPAQASPPSRGSLRGVALPAVVGFLLVAGQYDLLTFTIGHLTMVGFPLWVAALSLTAAQLGAAGGRIAFGLISDRIRSRPRAIALSAALGAAGIVVTALLPRATPLPVLLLLFGLTGAGAVGWNALVLTWGAERVAPELSGTAIGALGAAIFLGSAAFPPLFGWLAGTLHSYTVSFVLLGAQLGLAGVIALVGADAGVQAPTRA